MEIYGNKSTFNMETVLRKNITDSDYYRAIHAYETWSEVIDEIYNEVDSVEPWLTGNARGPSTAFCCLHKLCTLQLTPRDIAQTLSHPDSPYIRAVGFLYLRYVCDPKQIWGWVEQYIEDDEEFKPSPYADAITMGAFIRDLLLSQFYFETIFPRIPTVVEKHVKEELQKRGLRTVAVGNAGTGGPDRRGADEGNKRPASVKAALSVSFGQTAPNRRNARERDFRNTEPAKPAKVAKVAEKTEHNNNGGGGGRDSYDRDRRDRDNDRRDRDRDAERGDRDRDYGADRRDRGYGSSRRDRDYDRDYDRRDRDRRDRDYDYDGRRDSDRRDHRDRGGRDYQDRRDRRGDSGRRDYDRRDRGGGRDRSRSPPRRGGGGGRPASDVFRGDSGRPASDVFRDSSSVFRDAPVAPADLTNLKSRYG